MWKILGIAPTRDIKEIKAAYAKLAKQYNPEEKPEEFKRIFEAYKAACRYAKSMEKNFPRTEREQRGGSEQGYDFSNVDGEKKRGHNENAADGGNEQGYDFSNVDGEKRHRRNDSTPTEKFDFSSIDSGSREINSGDRTGSLRIDLIRKIKNIFDGSEWADIKTWKDFFYDTYFDEMVLDADFRWQARKIFFDKQLPRMTAKFVADKFGAGTICIENGYNRCTVIISDGKNVNDMYYRWDTSRKQSPNKKGKSDRLMKIIIIAAAVMIFGDPVISFLLGHYDSPSSNSPTETAASPSVITLPPYKEGDDIGEYIFEAAIAVAEEKTYEKNFLYESCKGKWLFDFGYIEFFDDHKATVSFNGETFDGTVIGKAADKGAVLYMRFRCENEAANGMEFTAHIISREGKRLICTGLDGNEYTGVYEQKTEESET